MLDWLHGSLYGMLAASVLLGGIFVARATVFQPVVYVKDDTQALPVNTDDEEHFEPTEVVTPSWPLELNVAEYDQRLLSLARYVPPVSSVINSTSTDTPVIPNPLRYSSSSNVTVSGQRWPAAAVYPNGGAILPFQRIIAYYGNFYSTRMGLLGEFEPPVVLDHLRAKIAQWEAADPDTPVMPAIHYIAMVAQAEAGSDGMYRAVMPDSEIEKGYKMAEEIAGILILDLQVGLSTLEKELPQFRDWMSKPEVHLGLDPEFSMKTGDRPGTVIGSFSAVDINFAIEWLSEIVREKQLPPKVLVIHRFTQNMVTEAAQIVPTPEVQVVMHMDGWGPKDLKRATYYSVIEPEPVQFTGVKVFYGNDMKPPSTGLLTPAELLELNPRPIYMQYQ